MLTEASVNGATIPSLDLSSEDATMEDMERNQTGQQTDEDIATEARSAFAPENFNQVTLIMLMRLYDLQLALLSSVNPEQAQYIVQLHECGQSFAPAPAFVEYAEPDD